MMRRGPIGVLVIAGYVAVAAQAPAVVEVSSVKESLNQQTGGGRRVQPSGLTLTGADLMMTIPWMFDIPVSFVETRIDWSRVPRGRGSLLNTRYDIEIRGTGEP